MINIILRSRKSYLIIFKYGKFIEVFIDKYHYKHVETKFYQTFFVEVHPKYR